MASRPNADLVSTHSTPPTASCFPNPSSLPPAEPHEALADSPRKSFTQASPSSAHAKARPLLHGLLSPPTYLSCGCPIDRASAGWLPPARCSQRLPQPRHTWSSHLLSVCNLVRACASPPPHIHNPQPSYRLDGSSVFPFLQMRRLRLRAANCPSQRDTAQNTAVDRAVQPPGPSLATEQCTPPRSLAQSSSPQPPTI